MTIPDTVTCFGNQAFSGCSNLSFLKIPEDILHIGKESFSNNSFIQLAIPDKAICSMCAICKCSKLKEFLVSPSNSRYKSAGGVIYSNDMKTLLKFPGGLKGEYIVSSDTEKIGYGAFCFSEIEKVELSASVKIIEEKAFNHSMIKELHIFHEHPEFLQVGNDAFRGLENCILYVPIGTGYAYRHHPAFKNNFKAVVITR